MSAQKIMFSVDGVPEPKPRMTQKDRYEPSPSVQRYWVWKKIVQLHVNAACAGMFEIIQGPVVVTAHFRLPIPASWSRAKKEDARKRMILPATRGTADYDNLLKGIKDAMNGMVYVDDSQVIGVGQGYMYHADDPGASLIVEEIVPPLVLPWDCEVSA